VGTDKDDAGHLQSCWTIGQRSNQRVVEAQLGIGPPSIPLGADPPYQTGFLEDPQVMGEEVGGDTERGCQLTWRGVPDAEVVDDPKPHRFAQGRVHAGTSLDLRFHP